MQLKLIGLIELCDKYFIMTNYEWERPLDFNQYEEVMKFDRDRLPKNVNAANILRTANEGKTSDEKI